MTAQTESPGPVQPGQAGPAQRLLVVSAHAADFVWRAAGYIALATAAGGTAHVVCLS